MPSVERDPFAHESYRWPGSPFEDPDYLRLLRRAEETLNDLALRYATSNNFKNSEIVEEDALSYVYSMLGLDSLLSERYPGFMRTEDGEDACAKDAEPLVEGLDEAEWGNWEKIRLELEKKANLYFRTDRNSPTCKMGQALLNLASALPHLKLL